MKKMIAGTPWYVHASFITSILLCVTSIFIPPYGVIDGSIIAAVGEILGGATLITFVVNIPDYIKAGINAKITHGNTSIEINPDEEAND